jgi:DNA primase catalytic core
MAITQGTIDEIRQKVDICDVIGQRIKLKPGGNNLMALCPFHGEKSPSFSVSKTKQFYHCFGCGKNGDVFSFVMEHDGKRFDEAVEELAQFCGVLIKTDNTSTAYLSEAELQARRQAQRQAQINREREKAAEQACKHAQGFYSEKLQDALVIGASIRQGAMPKETLVELGEWGVDAQKISDYIEFRGIRPEILADFGVGYAPKCSFQERAPALFDAFANYKSNPDLLEAGLVIDVDAAEGASGTAGNMMGNMVGGDSNQRRRDRFVHRLMFPIRDTKGRCVGFGGRVLDADAMPKYLNSPETILFQKNGVLYGLHEARAHISKQGKVFVVEGYMDVIMLAQYGIKNVVACMGTALTEMQLRLLLRFTPNVCMLFDGDAAGRRAAEKSVNTIFPLLETAHKFTVLELPNDLDPDEFVRQNGSQTFLDIANSALTLSQYFLKLQVEKYATLGKLDSPEDKTRFMDAVVGTCKLIDPRNPIGGLIVQQAMKMAELGAEQLPSLPVLSLAAAAPAVLRSSSAPAKTPVKTSYEAPKPSVDGLAPVDLVAPVGVSATNQTGVVDAASSVNGPANGLANGSANIVAKTLAGASSGMAALRQAMTKQEASDVPPSTAFPNPAPNSWSLGARTYSPNRDALGDRESAGVARPWLSKEDWLAKKNEQTKVLQLQKMAALTAVPELTIWERMCQAISINSPFAEKVVGDLLAVLDGNETLEQPVIALLQSCHELPFSSASIEELNEARDFLIAAPKLIAKHRKAQVIGVLKELYDSGELSEDDYVAQMKGLQG